MTTENTDNNEAPAINLEDPKVQEIIAKQVDNMVAEKTKGLVENKEQLLKEAKEAKGKLREINEKYGSDLSKFDELMEAEQKRKEAEMTEVERIEARYNQEKKQLQEMWNNKITTLESQSSAKDAAIHKYLVDSQLEAEISAAGGKSHFLKPALQSQLNVVEEGGEYKVRVMDNGVPRLNMDGTPMGIAELVSGYKADESWGAAFNATGATGGGATGNKQTTTNTNASNLTRSTMSPAEKVAYMGEHGSEAYLKLPE